MMSSGWNTYWQGTGAIGAFSDGEVNHPVILSFWKAFFSSINPRANALSILDVATGNGALIDLMYSVAPRESLSVTCIDFSPAAVVNVSSRFPMVQALVADAGAMPLAPGQFDIVSSQFGVEYAGTDAILESARMLAKGGRMALMLHKQGSSIHTECSSNLEAIQRFQNSHFVPLARQLLESAYNASQGGDRNLYEQSARDLQAAIILVDEIIDDFGNDVAGGSISKLYADVDRIHRNLLKFDLEEVSQWLFKIGTELEGYKERMQSMCGVALDENEFSDICSKLRANGMAVSIAKEFTPHIEGKPLAWILVAEHDKSRMGSSFSLSSVQGLKENYVEYREDSRAWLEEKQEEMVNFLMEKSVMEDSFFEVKPVWMLPKRVVVGRVRRPQSRYDFKWCITSSNMVDYVGDDSAVTTPREAIRYFSLKWQIDAERIGSEVIEGATNRQAIIDEAEFLYALSEEDAIWSDVV